MSDPVDLPALNYLGYSLDLTTVTPVDIKAVSESVKRGRQLIPPDPDDPIRVVTVNGVRYNVPKSVFVDQSVKLLQGNYITYNSGKEASSAFLVDVSLGARYMAFSGSVSTSYSVEKTFRKDDQFALYAFNASLYGAGLRNYADLLNQKALENRLVEMPHPFSDKPDTVREYKSFFASFGSHVIINSSYGMRFQLTVHTSSETEESKKNFSANVSAAYGGITTGGEFNADIKKTEQYKTFFTSQQKLLSVQGGDADKGLAILNDPTSYKTYTDWTKTAKQNPDLMNLTLTELWNVMKDASKPYLRQTAKDVEDAFNWIVSHPMVYKTGVTLTIQSDWAEFGLLTPCAVIIPDPNNPVPALTSLSNSKILWGWEHSHDQRRATIKFFILNDGSPLDFYTSHGSDGGSGGKGQAIVLMEQVTYLNDKISDNNWNTMWFWQAKASSTPAPSNAPRRRLPGVPAPAPAPPKPRRAKWDDVLNEYLRNIRHRHHAAGDEEFHDECDEERERRVREQQKGEEE